MDLSICGFWWLWESWNHFPSWIRRDAVYYFLAHNFFPGGYPVGVAPLSVLECLLRNLIPAWLCFLHRSFCVHAPSLSRVWLFVTLRDCIPPGSSVPGILQARILEWVAIPSSRGFSQPRVRTWVSCVAGRFFTIWATGSCPKIYSCVFTKFIHFARKCLETYHSGSLISSTTWSTVSIHEMKSSLISEKFSWIIILNVSSGPLFSSSSLETLVMHLLYLLTSFLHLLEFFHLFTSIWFCSLFSF